MHDLLRLLLDAFVVSSTAFAGVYQWWKYRFRNELQVDLEILNSIKGLPKEEENYKLLKAHVDNLLPKAYNGVQFGELIKAFKYVNPMDLVLVILFLLSALIWLLAFFKRGWHYGVVAVLFAICGIQSLFITLHRGQVKQSLK